MPRKSPKIESPPPCICRMRVSMHVARYLRAHGASVSCHWPPRHVAARVDVYMHVWRAPHCTVTPYCGCGLYSYGMWRLGWMFTCMCGGRHSIQLHPIVVMAYTVTACGGSGWILACTCGGRRGYTVMAYAVMARGGSVCMFTCNVWRRPAVLGGDVIPAAHFHRHLGIDDGMSIARVRACRYSKWPRLQGGRFEYRHAHTRAMDMPSAMPI